MQVVGVEDAVGNVLCHDITKIIPGKYKGAAFKKGHVITEEDIPELLKLGKEHLYVWEMSDGQVHENEAALRIAHTIKGPGISISEPVEGKVNLIADYTGVLIIEESLLLQVNMLEEIVVATRSNRRVVAKGDIVAGTRVVPLIIDKNKLSSVEDICALKDVVSVKPFHPFNASIITTGSEVFSGRIQDQFGPVVRSKMESYGCHIGQQTIVPDDMARITGAVQASIERGAEIVLITGGMSVDPDDLTPSAVRAVGADIVTYGAPVLPGAMLLVAYLGDIPILGLPGCVMYHKTTIFDLVMPMVLARERITRFMVAKLGLGGLCLKCEVCRYPACSFGTGA